jgi:hypothetical protein
MYFTRSPVRAISLAVTLVNAILLHMARADIISITPGTVYDVRASTADSFLLNDGSGVGSGALITTQNNSPVVISGGVDLGSVGSMIGIATDQSTLNLAGPVTGGALTVNGTGQFTAGYLLISTDAPTYGGATTVLLNAGLDLGGAGRITNTSNFDVRGTLRLDNRTSSLSDRVGDSIPITLSGGTLLLAQGAETLGPVTITPFLSELRFLGGGDLTIASLSRQNGSTLRAVVRSFDNNVDISEDLGNRAHLMIASAPALSNGVIPWATVGDNLATYGVNGLVPATTNATSINTASPTANVLRTSSESLTADRTINSLKLHESASVALQGKMLTINSGGIIATHTQSNPPPPSTISGGTLIPGASSNGELILHSISNQLNIGATIADGPTGNTTLIASGGHIVLSGANTYHGDTVVNRSFLEILSPDSFVPKNLTLNHGTIFFHMSQPANYVMGALIQRGSGQVGTDSQFPATINATSYSFEDGALDLPLVGSGPLTKNTSGMFLFRSSMPNFNGPVNLNGGLVQLLGASFTAGTGPIRVGPQAALFVDTSTVPNPLEIAGGRVTGTGRFLATMQTLSGPVQVTADSNVYGAGGSPVVFSGNTVINAGASLLAGGVITFSGSLQLHGPVNLTLSDYANSIIAAPAAGRIISGASPFGGLFELKNGGKLSPGSSIAGLVANSARFGPAGEYIWELANASAPPGNGFDSLALNADLTFNSDAAKPFVVHAMNLPGSGFDPGVKSSWLLASSNRVTGFVAGGLSIDSASFGGVPGIFSAAPSGTNLLLRYELAPGVSQWITNGGGDWGGAINWSDGTPDWPTASVNFLGALTATIPAHILLNGNRLAGSVNFDNANSYIIDAGTPANSRLGLGTPQFPAALNVLRGSHSITAPIDVGADLSVVVVPAAQLALGALNNIGGKGITKSDEGILTIGGNQTHGAGASLNILRGRVNLNTNSGTQSFPNSAAIANLKINISGADSKLVLGANQDLADLVIQVADPGLQSLDLATPPTPIFRSLRIYGGDLTAKKSYLYGLIRNANANPGDGIYDSGLLGAHPNSRLGIARLIDPHGDPFILIRPTRIGDLNLDGQVTIADFIDLAARFNSTGTWQEGDLNYDGQITIADFIDMSSNFNFNYTGESFPISAQDQTILADFAASVPEPSLLFAALGVSALMPRRIRGAVRSQ